MVSAQARRYNVVMPQNDFRAKSSAALADPRLREAVRRNTLHQDQSRRLRLADLPDANALRDLAGRIKQHALDHLDYYIQTLTEAVQKNGGYVHIASDGAEARRIILEIAKAAGCQRIIKSKSMATEEVHLTRHLEKSGLEVVETDLGEFIVQISGDRPSHLVAPIIHKDRASIAKVFHEFFHTTPGNDDAESLTRQARNYLREKFRLSDMGITGGNFLVAETGQVCVVENEGNARQSISTPGVLVSLVGIEKVVPRLVDLAVMLKLLARSCTGQAMTVYTNLFGGPRAASEKDGPREFHLVLLDNSRSEILADPEMRETLRCIRCGACLNACPVYRNIGGHAYGSVYPGPIGALISPLMLGLDRFADLPRASSLCGACAEACPVKIDIPKHLVQLRRRMTTQRPGGRMQRLAYRAGAWTLSSPALYGLVGRMQRKRLRRRADSSGWISSLPKIVSGWTDVRDLPAPARRSFHQLWKDRV